MISRLFCFLALSSLAFGNPCGPEGDAKRPLERAANPLKNRTEAPKTIYPAITLESMVAPGDDRYRFSNGDAATITGYVAAVKAGGLESVNCHAKDLAHRDTHIDLVVDAKDANNNKRYVIIEVTPAFRAEHPEWSTAELHKTILHKRIQVTGWLFFDAEHVSSAENTNPGKPRNWRATAWEIHPVVAMKLL